MPYVLVYSVCYGILMCFYYVNIFLQVIEQRKRYLESTNKKTSQMDDESQKLGNRHDVELV